MEVSQMTLLTTIKIIEETESPDIHLMAVSKSGFRSYFATGALSSTNTRPYTLQLKHIRLPPGYNKVIGESKPSSVQHVLYNRGNILILFFIISSCHFLLFIIILCIRHNS